MYLGRPENQRDPNAIRPDNQSQLGGIQNQQPQQPRQVALVQQQQPKGARPKKNLPKTINKPTHIADNLGKEQTMQNEAVAKNNIFVSSMSQREVNVDTRLSTSAPALIDISRLMYAEFVADNVNTQKNILPEYLDYYSTAMLWFRYITLKIKLCQPITQEERDTIL